MSKISLIDLSGVFRQHWHATEHETIGAAVRKTLQSVTGFCAGADHVGICIDSPPYKRTEIAPDYKAHREKAPEVMHEQMRACIDQLDADGWHILGAKGYEADDVIATIAAAYGPDDAEITIYSADKDLLQLVRPGIEVISTATGTVYATEADVVAKLGVGAKLVPDWLALVGDKSDNIEGVKGVGPKTAAGWLSQYGSLEVVLFNASRLEPERFRAPVEAARDLLTRSKILATLMTDAPIDPEIILTTKERKPTQEPATEPEIIEPEPVNTQNPDGPGKPSQMVAVAQAPIAPVEYERALEPRDSAGALRLAEYLFQSRLFGQFPSKEAILAVILAGRAHGLGAFQSLQGFHNIKGKPSASAQMIVGLVKRHPACKYFRLVEATDKQAVYETLRADEPEPTRMAYTIEQAKLAKLTGKDNWQNDPQAMLMARASSRLARAVYPDIVSGLYTPDEIDES